MGPSNRSVGATLTYCERGVARPLGFTAKYAFEETG